MGWAKGGALDNCATGLGLSPLFPKFCLLFFSEFLRLFTYYSNKLPPIIPKFILDACPWVVDSTVSPLIALFPKLFGNINRHQCNSEHMHKKFQVVFASKI